MVTSETWVRLRCSKVRGVGGWFDGRACLHIRITNGQDDVMELRLGPVLVLLNHPSAELECMRTMPTVGNRNELEPLTVVYCS